MKNFLLVFLILFFTVSLTAQNNFFFNANTNNLWSTPNNWAGGNPGEVPDDNTDIAYLVADPTIDANFTINQLEVQTGHTMSQTLSSTGASTVTIDINNSGTTDIPGIRNSSTTSGVDLTVAGNLSINNTGTNTNKATTIRVTTSGNNIIFSPTSILDIQTLAKTSAVAGASVMFDGMFTGGGNINLKDDVIFGATADNTGYNGKLIIQNECIISNSIVVGGTLASQLRANGNGTNGKLELNGANSFTAKVEKRNNAGTFTLDIDANQSNIGEILLVQGKLVIDISDLTGADIVSFANTSAEVWGGSTELEFVGFSNSDKIQFGVGGLTATQLSQITAVGYENFSINAGGFLEATVALPVELISFSGTSDKNTVNLKWLTATEIDNDFFTIEKSSNGRDFESIGKMEGAGSTTITQSYFFTDTRPHNGINYYRLKQTDFEGQFEYSKIISFEIKNDKEVNIFPNPVQDYITISGVGEEKATLQVFNMNGQLVLEEQGHFVEQKDIDFSALATGIYYLNIINTQGENVFSDKLIKK